MIHNFSSLNIYKLWIFNHTTKNSHDTDQHIRNQCNRNVARNNILLNTQKLILRHM